MKQCREMDSPRPRRNSWVLAQSLRGISELLKQKLWELYDNEEAIPQWEVSSRTVLIPKVPNPVQPDQYRPITCLNTMYKLDGLQEREAQ